MARPYVFTAEVRLFPQAGGWYYVAAPQEFTDELKPLAERGLVAVEATVGGSSWQSSLLPMGDGSQFLALPAKVRQKEHIAIGDMSEVSCVVR